MARQCGFVAIHTGDPCPCELRLPGNNSSIEPCSREISQRAITNKPINPSFVSCSRLQEEKKVIFPSTTHTHTHTHQIIIIIIIIIIITPLECNRYLPCFLLCLSVYVSLGLFFCFSSSEARNAHFLASTSIYVAVQGKCMSFCGLKIHTNGFGVGVLDLAQA